MENRHQKCIAPERETVYNKRSEFYHFLEESGLPMKRIVPMYLKTFFGQELELRVKLFHVLAITGFIICVIMTWVSLVGEMYISMAINMGAGVVSLGLLIYSTRTGKYRICYWISIVVIFLILFPSLFFSGGGYKGGMPFFFVFAVVFTVYMLDGWGMLVTSLVEMGFYSWLCWLAYEYPGAIVPFASEEAVVTDVIIGLITVSISLGATMFVQVRMYQRQQRELEAARKEAEAASQAKSTFLANMSHEIRTPIHVILGMNEIIHRQTRRRQVREYSERIEETSKMLLSLVDSVLDVSKIESGKMELLPQAYTTAELVKTLTLIGKTQCSRKNLHFRAEIDPNLPPRLWGDLPHIRQIASNFLSNAVKYTEKGSITLEITGEPQEEGFLLQISVSDTGIGIRKDVLPTLFEAFSRADVAAHRNIEGTGLGLTIVRELTDLMGGTVAVESKPGQGSTFSVKLPQQLPEPETRGTSQAALSFCAPEARMLVVDDNEGNRMVMRELLAGTEMKVETAESGFQCLEMVEKTRYDIILMDYMMPGLDGAETMERLKENPAFSTPVIALTADATAETEQRLMAGGFAACLVKPIPWPRLRDALLRCLPPEKVSLIREVQKDRGDIQSARTLLEPYAIVVDSAMPYVEDSLEKYCATAALFLRYDGTERKKVERFLEDGSCERLRYPIHALKGKARNLGMERLEELCIYAEGLCVEEKAEELRSLLPYLFYTWGLGSEGLRKLMEQQTAEKNEKTTESRENAGERCSYEELEGYLKAFQRKPSREGIEGLLREETEDWARSSLEQMETLVDSFRFDQALEEFAAYRRRKEGVQ